MLKYSSETCILKNRDRKQMNIFERKMYRIILSPVYNNEKENWGVLTKKVNLRNCKKSTVTDTINLNRLCLFGHIQRIEEN
jgi:hypothetical protein